MGNTGSIPVAIWTGLGSPPHTWGIPAAFNRFLASLRITPTYMGNTESIGINAIKVEDHPHIHGEYATGTGALPTSQGSPPHTWGIQTHRLQLYRSFQDHPHIHGEYTGGVPGTILKIGSPPHTWGILKSFISSLLAMRITPTYMGNT